MYFGSTIDVLEQDCSPVEAVMETNAAGVSRYGCPNSSNTNADRAYRNLAAATAGTLY